MDPVAPTNPTPPPPAAAGADAKAADTLPFDYKAKLLTLLGLPDTATDEEIKAKLPEVSTAIGSIGDLQTKASSADQLQQQLDDIQKKYQDLNDQQTAIFKAKQEAEADEILKVYEGVFTDEASKAAIRNILLNDKDAGIAILNGLKKPEAATPPPDAAAADKGTPPAPKHDPAAAATVMTAEEKVTALDALIKTIRKEGKFKDYSSAREEARRRKPELFS